MEDYTTRAKKRIETLEKLQAMSEDNNKPQDNPKEGDVEKDDYKKTRGILKEFMSTELVGSEPVYQLTALQQIRMHCIEIAAPLNPDTDTAIRVAVIFEHYILGTRDAQEKQSDA